MLKKDKNYRLPKSVKRLMAGKLCTNPNQFKNSMIEAEIIGSVFVKQSKKQKTETKSAGE